MADLADLQGWFQAAIIDRERGANPPDADRVVRGSDRLSALDGLAVYRNGYRARLLECLRASHPALRHALGDELLDAFADDYLREHPSRSYTLSRLDEALPAFLEATRPDDELWPQFIVDLARIERLFNEVFDGPGNEGKAVLTVDDVPQRPDRVWLNALRPVPCLRLLASRFPVGRYLTAVRCGERPESPHPAPAFIALHRRDYVVRLVELDREQFAVLSALVGGEPVGEQAWPWVRSWAGQGFLRARED